VGLGVTTIRTGGPGDLTFVERAQQLTAVAKLDLTLQLPAGWRLRLGVSAAGTPSGGGVKVGVTVEKNF
jgi:hypothetical protein